jgi:hypothetical protein
MDTVILLHSFQDLPSRTDIVLFVIRKKALVFHSSFLTLKFKILFPISRKSFAPQKDRFNIANAERITLVTLRFLGARI